MFNAVKIGRQGTPQMAMERDYTPPAVITEFTRTALVGLYLGNTTDPKDKPQFAILRLTDVDANEQFDLALSLDDLRDIKGTIERFEMRNPDLYSQS